MLLSRSDLPSALATQSQAVAFVVAMVAKEAMVCLARQKAEQNQQEARPSG